MSDSKIDAVQNQQVGEQTTSDRATPDEVTRGEATREHPVKSSAPDAERRRAVFFLAVGALLGSAGLLLSRPARADMGKCYLCGCCHFVGTTDNCNHCGHSYSDHTGRTCN